MAELSAEQLKRLHTAVHGANKVPETDDFVTGFVQWVNSLEVPGKEELTVERAIEALGKNKENYGS